MLSRPPRLVVFVLLICQLAAAFHLSVASAQVPGIDDLSTASTAAAHCPDHPQLNGLALGEAQGRAHGRPDGAAQKHDCCGTLGCQCAVAAVIFAAPTQHSFDLRSPVLTSHIDSGGLPERPYLLFRPPIR